MDSRDVVLNMEGRISSLEAKVEQDKETLDDHETLIRRLDKTLEKVSNQVTGIRNALYLLSAAVACNIPVFQHFPSVLGEIVKSIFLP